MIGSYGHHSYYLLFGKIFNKILDAIFFTLAKLWQNWLRLVLLARNTVVFGCIFKKKQFIITSTHGLYKEFSIIFFMIQLVLVLLPHLFQISWWLKSFFDKNILCRRGRPNHKRPRSILKHLVCYQRIEIAF